MPPTPRAWIALGANLGDRERALRRALRWLGATPGVDLEAASSFRLTAPVGPPQPPYLNAVARIRTPLAPRALLTVLQHLERAAGRRRGLRWGPRTLDLDLLLVDGVRLDHPDLILPHPRMAERRFVLAPLCELDPHLVHPVLDRRMRDLLQALPE
ncbi:MAG: 2-amino-4-hydroxy-6-hydroxymethyldihydropteridine diphosphokinase [Myxococcota bacterium]